MTVDRELVVDTPTGSGGFDERQVPLYYSRKTQDILYKYGPGPRIHFHVGLFDRGDTPNTTVSQHVVHRRLRESQERMVQLAARRWGVFEHPPADLLDVGCGVGGGAIYWAQEHGARVTGVTVTADHIPVITDLAAQAGVGDRITPVLSDIHHFKAERRYDAAVALESSGYMDRERLFEVVARSLRPGGWFGIEEHFLARPEYGEFIDAYYKTRLGTLTEYLSAARSAGFVLEEDEDLTERVAEFWVQSLAWNTLELERIEQATAGDISPIKRERLTESALAHAKFFRVWRDRAVETRLLLFRLHG